MLEFVGSANATGNYGGQTSQTATNLTKVRIGGVVLVVVVLPIGITVSFCCTVAFAVGADVEPKAKRNGQTNRKQTATKQPRQFEDVDVDVDVGPGIRDLKPGTVYPFLVADLVRRP